MTIKFHYSSRYKIVTAKIMIFLHQFMRHCARAHDFLQSHATLILSGLFVRPYTEGNL